MDNDMKNCSVLLLLLLLALAGCSGDEDSAGPATPRGHVWQEQTDMIERAKDVEDLLGGTNAVVAADGVNYLT
jgi:hypothetical protein